MSWIEVIIMPTKRKDGRYQANVTFENPLTGEKVTVCHELGHARLHAGYGYYLHPDRAYYVRSRLEAEANEYAAHLLAYSTDIDSDQVTHIINQRRPDPREVHLLLGRFIDTQVW